MKIQKSYTELKPQDSLPPIRRRVHFDVALAKIGLVCAGSEMGTRERWEHKVATRGQRTAGNLRHRPQPTAKLPCCSRSSRTYFRCSDAPRSRGVGKESANYPSFAPWEEKLDSVHQIAPQRALKPLELRRQGAEPGAQEEGAGAALRGVNLSPAIQRGQAAAKRSRHSPGALPPTRVPSPSAPRSIPTPHPQLSLLLPPGKGTGPRALSAVVGEDACLGVGCVLKPFASAGEESSRDNAAQTFLPGSVGRKRPSLSLAENPKTTQSYRRDRAVPAQELFPGTLEVPSGAGPVAGVRLGEGKSSGRSASFPAPRSDCDLRAPPAHVLAAQEEERSSRTR